VGYDLVLSAISWAFEITGFILLGSSIFGPERIEKYEAKIRLYFDVQAMSSHIQDRLYPAQGCLVLLVGIVVFLVAIWVWVRTLEILVLGVDLAVTSLVPLLFIGKAIDNLKDSAVGASIWTTTTYVLGCLLGVLYMGGLVTYVLFVIPRITKIVAGVAAIALAIVCGIIYAITIILGIPYIVTDRMAPRIGARSTLALFGTVLGLVGILIRFPNAFGLI
jgi:hypothetical protein